VFIFLFCVRFSDEADVELAIKTKNATAFTPALPKAEMMEIAKTRNSIPLPLIKPRYGDDKNHAHVRAHCILAHPPLPYPQIRAALAAGPLLRHRRELPRGACPEKAEAIDLPCLKSLTNQQLPLWVSFLI
jgi:hypothetical protein